MPIYRELAQRAIDDREARLAESAADIDDLLDEDEENEDETEE